ncbi:MAG: DUF3383 domain-containing protein, partial [Clostridiales bacterium]|nr:DUF3383 domain-containing protein [Clostridiales bacterium]
ANKKIYAGTIAPSAIGSAAAPASDYALYLVHDAKEQYPEAALIGKMLGWRPGEATWMFKRLDGISPVHFNDQAASVELINSKHYMTYVSKHGLNVTTGGYVTSGEYADVVLGVQWMQSSMELRIFNLLASSPKVPYDNGGIALIAAQVDAALKEATRAGVIRRMGGGMGDYAVSIPNVEDIDPADIAGRVLRDITFSATLAGAVHGAKIRGTVQYASVLGAAA